MEAAKGKLECDSLPLATNDYNTKIEDFVGFWSTSREKTASSKSNCHFSHYKASSCDDLVSATLVTKIFCAHVQQTTNYWALCHWYLLSYNVVNGIAKFRFLNDHTNTRITT